MRTQQKPLFPEWFLQANLIYDTIVEAVLIFILSIGLTDILFGNAIPQGFNIYEPAAILPFLVLAGYFAAMHKIFNGTVARRLNNRLRKARR